MKPAITNDEDWPGASPGGAAPGLPCLDSDNSIGDHEHDPVSKLTSSQRKTAYALRENVEHFVKLVGLDNVGFLTLTFGDHVTDWKIGQKRFNSMMSNYGRNIFPRHLCVMEPQKSGRIHYHLLVDCGFDIRTGFVFEEIKRGNYRSANGPIRSLWLELRKILPRYGFGRHELLPIRSNGEGISKYLAKYIAKGVEHRDPRFKGARWVRYSRGWRKVGVKFSWASPGGWCYRKKLALFAEHSRVTYEGMRKMYGPKWAYKLGDLFETIVIPEYPDMRHVIADKVSKWEYDDMPGIWNGTNIRLGSMQWSGRLSAASAVRLAIGCR